MLAYGPAKRACSSHMHSQSAYFFFFYSHRFIDVEACASMADGETSHGFCDQKEWRPPFDWMDYLSQSGFSFYYRALF